MRLLSRFILLMLCLSACNVGGKQIVLVDGDDNKKNPYSIVVPAAATEMETRSAKVLQDYMRRVSGKTLTITSEGSTAMPHAIYIGMTKKATKVIRTKLPAEGYVIQLADSDLVICGNGKGLIYGVYTFIEKQLGCRKVADAPAIIPEMKQVRIPAGLHLEGKPQFVYREAYYPASHDAEYVEWNQLQRFEELWGLWGHSFDKLVPAATFFKTHPEYYALVNGVRQPTQLCLANKDVFAIVTGELKRRIAENPAAIYWSVAPNDTIGYCACDKCKATDDAQGSPAGSLVQFVNRVAAVFPDKNFTTLAYGYTHLAPKNLGPASNVHIFLSTIAAYRDMSLEKEPTAEPFRNDVKAWRALTPNLFVWDYTTQFTNYLAPFPNLLTLQANIQYFKASGIKGVFAQGSGETYSEWAELRSYVLAKLLEDDTKDVKVLTESFLQDYYGIASKFLLQYIGQVHGNMAESKRKLDIYGDPVNEWNTYLSPERLAGYLKIFDAAEDAVRTNPAYAERVMRARLPLEYTMLQQARFFGIKKYGVFEKNEDGAWVVTPGLARRINLFVANCKKANVTELSEGGLSPDGYQAEWNAMIAAGVTPAMLQARKQ